LFHLRRGCGGAHGIQSSDAQAPVRGDSGRVGACVPVLPPKDTTYSQESSARLRRPRAPSLHNKSDIFHKSAQYKTIEPCTHLKVVFFSLFLFFLTSQLRAELTCDIAHPIFLQFKKKKRCSKRYHLFSRIVGSFAAAAGAIFAQLKVTPITQGSPGLI